MVISEVSPAPGRPRRELLHPRWLDQPGVLAASASAQPSGPITSSEHPGDVPDSFTAAVLLTPLSLRGDERRALDKQTSSLSRPLVDLWGRGTRP
jgi:hypothetical protein